HGVADEGAGRGAEGEGERRVAERGDAVGSEGQPAELVPAEHRRAAAVADGLADGIRPPGIHEAERLGDGHGGQADQRELDRQPLGPGDALVPGQPVGPGLELTGDQRGTPEDAEERGRGEDEYETKWVRDVVHGTGLQLVEEAAGRVRAAVALA